MVQPKRWSRMTFVRPLQASTSDRGGLRSGRQMYGVSDLCDLEEKCSWLPCATKCLQPSNRSRRTPASTHARGSSADRADQGVASDRSGSRGAAGRSRLGVCRWTVVVAQGDVAPYVRVYCDDLVQPADGPGISASRCPTKNRALTVASTLPATLTARQPKSLRDLTVAGEKLDQRIEEFWPGG